MAKYSTCLKNVQGYHFKLLKLKLAHLKQDLKKYTRIDLSGNYVTTTWKRGWGCDVITRKVCSSKSCTERVNSFVHSEIHDPCIQVHAQKFSGEQTYVGINFDKMFKY